jgi:galactokinase
MGLSFPWFLPVAMLTQAIDRCTVLLGRPNGGDSFSIVTCSDVHGDNQTLTIPRDLSALAPEPGHHWGNYVKGVFHAFAARNPPACDIAIASTVPLGGGLSSSASLEVFLCCPTHPQVATYSFLQAALGEEISNTPEKALACQKAEHDFAHVPCGVMDQFISTLAEADHALLLDCRLGQPRAG